MTAPASNPAAAFYASPLARALGAAVRAAHGVSTDVGTALAMRLFFTPRAPGRRSRLASVPAPWRAQSHRFEQGGIVSWQRSDTAGRARRVLLTHGWAGDAQQMRGIGDAHAMDRAWITWQRLIADRAATPPRTRQRA